MHFPSKRSLILALLVGVTPCVVAQSADRQFQFAEHLEKSGDTPFALLEYKRFVFQSPKDPRAAQAHRKIADIYFGYLKDIPSGKSSLATLIKDFPKSPEAIEAQEILNLFAIHRDADEKLLLDFLEGRRLAQTGNVKGAVSKLKGFASNSPDPNLEAAALLEAGRLELRELKKPQDAITTLEQLVKKYPKREEVNEALFLTGEAWEKLDASGSKAIRAYDLVAANKGPFQQKAIAAVKRLKDAQNLPKHQFDTKLASEYKSVRTDYNSDTMIVTIEVSSGATTEALKATMEKALFEAIPKRRDPKHHIVVSAYYSYPITEAGGVNWKVGSDPRFTVKKMKAEDAVKTILFDIFK